MQFLSFLCTKWIGNCEAMTSSTRSFAYSYQLVKKCFLKIFETSTCHNFLIFQPIFIRISLFYSQICTLSYEIKLNLFRISPLRRNVAMVAVRAVSIFYRYIGQLFYLIGIGRYCLRICTDTDIREKNEELDRSWIVSTKDFCYC